MTYWILTVTSRRHKTACPPTIHLPDVQGALQVPQNYSEAVILMPPFKPCPQSELEMLRMHKPVSIQQGGILGSYS